MTDTSEHDHVLEAAEYVLGTLESRDRSRFETRLMHDQQARAELAYWEDRLGSLGLALAPVDPPQRAWAGIADEVGLSAPATASTTRRDQTTITPSPAANDAGLWRGVALVASVAALVMAGFLFAGSSQPDVPAPTTASSSSDAPAYASLVYDEPTGTSWLVTAPANSDKMKVVAMGDYDVPEGKVLRAWVKPEDGEPVLLGKWPHTHGDHEMTVSQTAAKHMDKAARLMVSMEDAGSNAQASAPSGKLMWTSPIARRTG